VTHWQAQARTGGEARDRRSPGSRPRAALTRRRKVVHAVVVCHCSAHYKAVREGRGRGG
jgi:hypothetical protein